VEQDSKLEVVSTTDSEPFGVDTASDIAIGDIANTYRDGTIFTFFDAGNITTQDVQKYSRMLQSHNIG
jgi:DNA topoisomerase VI subunit A